MEALKELSSVIKKVVIYLSIGKNVKIENVVQNPNDKEYKSLEDWANANVASQLVRF